MATFSSLLKSVFDNLFIWRDTVSSKAWALEKMRDVFCKELKLNPDQIEVEDFAVFLQSFYDNEDSCNLMQYPEFVMNTTSEMMSQVILSRLDVQEKDLTLMFKLLRSAVTHGQFDKGQRISTMFDCLKRLLIHRKTMELMVSCQFDATYALLFAVGSTQNYTRKSAKEYFIELVKFTFNDSEMDDNVFKKARTSARDVLTNLFRAFNKLLVQRIRITTPDCSFDIVANYSRILSSCVECSSNWGNTLGFDGCAAESTFNVWCDLLKYLNTNKFYDIGDVVVSSVEQLAVLAAQRKPTIEGGVAFEMLSSLVIVDMVDASSDVEVSDVILMAHSIVSRCHTSLHSSPMRERLLTLSILPLLVILGVPVPDGNSLRHAIEATKEELEKESKTKRSSTLISRAMTNAFSLVENKEFLDASIFASTTRYATFKTRDPPEATLKPFMRKGVVLNRTAFDCLISAFKLFHIAIDDPTQELKVYEAETVQTYIAPVSNFYGISHRDLTAALDCYLATLHRLITCGTPYSKECLLSVLEALELHLVNVDPNLREAAVKKVGQLYLLESATVLEEKPVMSAKFLSSVWKCVRDKEENVVTQVLEFILSTVKSGDEECLRGALTHMHITQGELMTELQSNLLSGQWDNIKPVAFSLYSSLTISSDAIRYAEICMQQSMSFAIPAVFDFITKLFTRHTERLTSSSESNVDRDHDNRCAGLENGLRGLCELLWEGWGDLLLTALNGDNTTCLRYAVDVLVSLHAFVAKDDVALFVKEKMENVNRRHGVENRFVVNGLEMLKRRVANYSKSALKGSFFLQSLDDGGEIDDQCMLEKDDDGDAGKLEGQKTDSMANIVDKDTPCDMQISDQRFDHTIERRPFAVSTSTFPLPDIVSEVLDQLSLSGAQSDLKRLFIFFGFREFLDKLRLKSMKEEVNQSTDEYDRNSVTILKDINNSLDSSFQILCRKLEKEVVAVFIVELFEILESLLAISRENHASLVGIKEPLAKLDSWMKVVLTSIESFSRFVLSQRRKVFIGEIDSSKLESLSVFFDSGLAVFRHELSKDISLKSYFSSSNGLKELLDMYVSSRGAELDTDVGKFSGDCINNSESLHAHKKVTVNDNNIKLIVSEEELQTAVGDIKKSKELSKGGAFIALNSTTLNTSVEKPTIMLLLELFQRIIVTCKQCVDTMESETPGNLTTVGVDTMLKAVDEIKEMEEEFEDDFDSGNDPTSIDCY